MAVTIKQKALTIKSLVKRLFPNNEQLQKMALNLEVAGYTLVTEASALKIVSDTSTLLTASVKSTGLYAALDGELSSFGTAALKASIEAFITKAYHLIADDKKTQAAAEVYAETMKAYHKGVGEHKVAAIKVYRTMTGSSLKEAKDQVEAWLAELATKPSPSAETAAEVVDKITKPKEDVVMDLNDAVALKQPVKGTNAGSVYHTIALGPHAKVAVRIKADNDVAIRVQPLNGQGTAACAAAGLDMKKEGHYSIHLHPESESLISKTVGAVLFALSLPWTAIVTDVMPLKGVGK